MLSGLSLILLLANGALAGAQSSQEGNITVNSVDPALQQLGPPPANAKKVPANKVAPAHAPVIHSNGYHPIWNQRGTAAWRNHGIKHYPAPQLRKPSDQAAIKAVAPPSFSEVQAGVLLAAPNSKAAPDFKATLPTMQAAAPNVKVTTPVAKTATPLPAATQPQNTVSAPLMMGSAPLANPPAAAPAKTESLTKPDLLPTPDPAAPGASAPVHTQDNPFAAVGDSGKMLLYLAPILLVTLAALHLLRRAYARGGGRRTSAFRTPGPPSRNDFALAPSVQPTRGLMGALLGGFHLNNARQRGGGSIRLVESVPVGSANLHLIEVRGKVLLIGATNAGVSLLTEFEQATLDTGDFRALLHAAAADMDALNLDSPDIPVTAMVTTLEDAMRDTSDTLRRGARRLRTVQEAEDETI